MGKMNLFNEEKPEIDKVNNLTVDELVLEARRKGLWLKSNQLDYPMSPMEYCQALTSGEITGDNSLELIDPDKLIDQYSDEIEKIKDKIESIVHRKEHASDDDKEASLPIIRIGEKWMNGSYDNIMSYMKYYTDSYESDDSNFWCGTDSKVGYIEELGIILASHKNLLEGKEFIVIERLNRWNEDESIKILISDILSKERLTVFYNDFKEFSIKCPNKFNKAIEEIYFFKKSS